MRYPRWRQLINVLIAACCFCSAAAPALSYCYAATANSINEPSSTEYSQNSRYRIRVSWGGGSDALFTGDIHVVGGEFSNPAILGLSSSSSSSLQCQSRRIAVRPITPSSFEGVDIDVRGTPETTIVIEFANVDGGVVHRQFTIADVLKQDRVAVLDRDGNRISIAVAPGAVIDFSTERKHLIFETGERFDFSLGVNTLTDEEQEYLIEVVRADSRQGVLFSHVVRVTAGQRVEQSINVPVEEGVYSLRFHLASAPSNRSHRQRSPIEREIQFVVFNADQRSTSASVYNDIVHEIAPETLKTSLAQQQWGQLSRRFGLRGSQAVGRFDVEKNGKAVHLPVGGWQAVPLRVEDINSPHVIEIDYPAKQPMSLGLSVLQADETGQVPNFGFDSGLIVSDSIIHPEQKSTTGTHRFVFWPHSKHSYLLIANRSSARDARYYGIRLLKRSSLAPPRSLDRLPIAKRGTMVFIEQPIFAENFGVNSPLDVSIGQPIQDWNSFFEGINRLAQYLVDSGAKGAFVNVLGEGSALMPLETMLPSARYDNGVFASNGRDPIRKDVVELIYRIFAREGLQFVPVLAFDHHDARIEFNPAAKTAAQLTDSSQQKIDRDSLPVYNPLSPDVQASVVQTIAEVAQRYSHHQSYQGVAIANRPDTYTLLPGSRLGGYDDETQRRFATASGINAGDLENADHQEEWLNYRRLQMSRWYLQMAQAAQADSASAKLYLAFVDIFKHDELKEQLSPSLHRSCDLDKALQVLGLDLPALHSDERIAVMTPHVLDPLQPLAKRKSEIAATSSPQWARWSQGNDYPIGLFVHRSSWARFENLESSGIFSRQTLPIFRLQHLSPAGVRNQERYAKMLLEGDVRRLVDGGLLVNTNLDHELVAFNRTFSQIPDIQFEDVKHQTFADERHPIAVRQIQIDGQSYIYAVNGSPWKIDVRVSLSAKNPIVFEPLYKHEDNEVNGVNQYSSIDSLDFVLEPFGLIGFKTPDTEFKFAGFNYQLPESASRQLGKNYYALRARVVASGKAPPINVLNQPSFELGNLGDDWAFDGNHRQAFECVSNDAIDGNYALSIRNRLQKPIWIRGNAFATPETGRLSVSVWLKKLQQDQQPPLRISVEGTGKNRSYYRFAEVGALAADKRNNQITDQWRRFVVHFDDVPVERAAQLRVGLDMMGPGTVLVDQFELYDRWMDENDLKALTQKFAGVSTMIDKPEKLERCRQILNGYWPEFLRINFSDSADDISRQTPAEPVFRSSMRRRFRRFVSPSIFQFR